MFNISEAIIVFLCVFVTVNLTHFIISLLKFNYDDAEVYFKMIVFGVIILILLIMIYN